MLLEKILYYLYFVVVVYQQWGYWKCGEAGTYPISYKQSGINTIGLHVGKLGNINVILDSDRIGSKTNFLFTGSGEGNYAVYYWSIGK